MIAHSLARIAARCPLCAEQSYSGRGNESPCRNVRTKRTKRTKSGFCIDSSFVVSSVGVAVPCGFGETDYPVPGVTAGSKTRVDERFVTRSISSPGGSYSWHLHHLRTYETSSSEGVAVFRLSPSHSGDKRDDISAYALQIGERPVCHPTSLSSGPGTASGRCPLVFSKLSKLLHQEHALGAPCLHAVISALRRRPSLGAGMLRTDVIRRF